MVKTWNQLWSIHAMGLLFALVAPAFLIAGWLPPPSPNMSDAEIAGVFDDGNLSGVRVGAAMLFFAGPFWILPAVAIAGQMRRIEGPDSTLARIQMLMAPCGTLAFQLGAVAWLVASYRTDAPDSVIVSLNDFGWFFMLGAVSPLVIQMAVVGICILQGDGTVYPRWVGYFTLWLAMAELPTVCIPFVKTGPLAWDGVLAWWCPVISFFTWCTVMWIQTVRAIRSERAAELVAG